MRLDEVRVTWDGRAALEGVSLDLAPGDRIGVVGPSGSGKSTLAALLLRFNDPTSGRLTMAGVDLRDLALDDVRARVGLVDDDPHVFASTLAENVRLARPGATDEDVERAVRAAGLGSWLDALPDGLGTWLGDGHAQVSGGERARIGVARSLLADQPVLVLDEPTAHLDHATAELVTAAVLRAASGRSLVWMTHEGDGLERMDRVLDLGACPVSGRGLAFRR
jgi:ATP-binding cassette subfamily C protein CydCD